MRRGKSFESHFEVHPHISGLFIFSHLLRQKVSVLTLGDLLGGSLEHVARIEAKIHKSWRWWRAKQMSWKSNCRFHSICSPRILSYHLVSTMRPIDEQNCQNAMLEYWIPKKTKSLRLLIYLFIFFYRDTGLLRVRMDAIFD